METKFCDFNIKTGHRGEIMCDEGYKKFRIEVSTKKGGVHEIKYLCRFCLDRYVSRVTKEGYTVSFRKHNYKKSNNWKEELAEKNNVNGNR